MRVLLLGILLACAGMAASAVLASQSLLGTLLMVGLTAAAVGGVCVVGESGNYRCGGEKEPQRLRAKKSPEMHPPAEKLDPPRPELAEGPAAELADRFAARLERQRRDQGGRGISGL